MAFETTPRAAAAFVKASVFLACSWPPNAKANSVESRNFRVRWWIAFVLLGTLFLPLLNGVWTFRGDPIIAVKAVLMASATAQALMKILVCRYQRSSLQALHVEMEDFFNEAKTSELRVLELYLKRCSKFYGLVTILVYLACLGFIVEPLLLSQPFPTDSAFPFPTDFRPIYEIIYVQQALAIFHIASALTIDNQVAILIWYTSARFFMLGDEIEKSKNHRDIVRCVEKHQRLLIYAENVTRTTRLIALATIVTTTVGIICGGLTLISRQPISVKLRVSNLVFNAGVELFLYAWPADDLIATSQAIGRRAYNSAWPGKSSSTQKILVGLIHRSQKPVTISVGGFLPTMSLNYYASFLSSSFSYFSAMRIVYNAES